MKAKELRAKDAAALDKELGELLRAHFSLRNDTSQLRKTRRAIARVRTVINEKAAA
jgi:large subunit ribosomal protein L29